MSDKKPTQAKVGKYEDRPLEDALADPKDIAKAENRQPDQIVDYHKDNKTWTSSKAVEDAVGDPEGTPAAKA